MPIFGAPTITAVELARRITSDSDPCWDWGQRPIKNLLFDMGKEDLVFGRRKGLPEGIEVQEWLLDLVWMEKATMDVKLAVESEFSLVMPHRLDDFEKLMSTKAPLKLFIYATRNSAESDDVRRKLTEYLQRFRQHLEGEEYLLMDVGTDHADFYHFTVPNSGSVSDAVFMPLQFGLGSSA